MNVSFGTRIILQNKQKQQNEINKRFAYSSQRKFNISMSDAWVGVEKMPELKSAVSKNKIFKIHKKNNEKDNVYTNKEFNLNGKYKVKKNPVYGMTKAIEICTGGVIIGNNGDIAMFHIAPTMENKDFLIIEKKSGNQKKASENPPKDDMGNSIDKFGKSSGGIKNAVIVGGNNQNTRGRGEYSDIVNKAILSKFLERNIPVSSLSDLKFFDCDLFYSSATDTLKIGVNSNKAKLSDLFGDVNLHEKDTIELNFK